MTIKLRITGNFDAQIVRIDSLPVGRYAKDRIEVTFRLLKTNAEFIKAYTDSAGSLNFQKGECRRIGVAQTQSLEEWQKQLESFPFVNIYIENGEVEWINHVIDDPVIVAARRRNKEEWW